MENITKEEFIDTVKKTVDLSARGTADIGSKEMTGNNGAVSMFVTATRGGNVIASVSMEAFYGRFCDTQDISVITEAAKAVIQALEQADDQSRALCGFIYRIHDYAAVRENLRLMLVNTAMNRAWLAEMPNMPFEDLSIIFYLECQKDCTGRATIKVNNSIFSQWRVTMEQMYQDALGNMQEKLPPELKSVFSVLAEMGEINEMGNFTRAGAQDQELCLYCLSNREQYMGAAALLYPGVLESCAEKMGGDFYLLPSSVHEVLLCPALGCETGFLKEMICGINTTTLEPDEILADHAYFYSAKERKLTAV